MKKISISTINQKIKEGASEFVSECSKRYANKLEETAQTIYETREEKPVLLISGPSGSGKTTTAIKLDELLEAKGITVHTISLDDYFLPADQYVIRYDKHGKPDYETPDRIDFELLKKDMTRLWNGERVTLPKFNFADQSRGQGETISLGKNEMVAIESIHALNPIITNGVQGMANTMYISVRRRTELEDGTMLHPKFHRLMRRLIRDRSYRGRSFADTLDMFKSVQLGEDKYIMPYKHEATIQIDTYFAYEPALYKKYILDELEKTAETYEGFEPFEPMLRALREIDPLDESLIPANALCREFIGGSSYSY